MGADESWGRTIGDGEEWVARVDAMRPLLRGVASRRLAQRDRSAVDDAVAETLARTCRRASEHRLPAAALESWVVAVLCNVVREQNRRAARPEAAWAPPAGSDPLDVLLAAEESAQVRRAFAALPEPDREVLRLRLIEGLDSEAAAARLGKRAGAIRMAQTRALGRLRQHLASVAG